MQLATTDIDRDHMPGAARQKHIGEATGRSSKIKTCPPGRIDAENVERMSQFDATARHPRMGGGPVDDCDGR